MSIDIAEVRQPAPDVDHDMLDYDMLDRDQVDMLDRDQVEAKQKEEAYTKQIGPLERQYIKMVRSMESAIDELRVTQQSIIENHDDIPAVQSQIQGYIDDCKHRIEIAQTYLSHAMMTDEKIIDVVRSKIKTMYEVFPSSTFRTQREKDSLLLRNIEQCMLIFWFTYSVGIYTHWDWCKITPENALEEIKNRVLPLLKEAVSVKDSWDMPGSKRDILTGIITEIISDIETWLYLPTLSVPIPLSIETALPTQPKLPLKLYIIGEKFWAMPPITQHQKLGLELLLVVPFDNWVGLHCSIDHGNDEGTWREIYTVFPHRNSALTPEQIQRGVTEELDTVQTEAFEALQRDPTTILSLYLGTQGVFKMPEAIQPWIGVKAAMSDNIHSLLTTLLMTL
jgi:hypothetical protein